MNKSLLYVGGAVLGIGAAVAVFSVIGGGEDPSDEPVALSDVGRTEPYKEGEEPIKEADGVVFEPVKERRAPPAAEDGGKQPVRADQQVIVDLLERPISQLISGTDSSLRHLSMQVRAAGDEALADDIVQYIDEVRGSKRDPEVDEAAIVSRLKALLERAEQVSGLNEEGQRSLGLVQEKLAEYEG